MRGFIFVALGEGERAFELSKTPVTIGSSTAASLQIAAAGVKAEHAVLTWQPSAATWQLSSATTGADAVSVNGQAVSSRPVNLEDYDRLEIGGVLVRFRRVPQSARYRGAEVTEILLKPANLPLAFGKDAAMESLPGVRLDDEDPDVSLKHLVIESIDRSRGFEVTDHSQAGTLLNGRNFQRERLVIGDRFRIGSYNFEFTGYSVKRVSGVVGGRVEARNVTVEVPNRQGKGMKAILQDVNVDVDQCAFVGILGGSGQGKSTFLNALCGIAPPTAGQICIDGVDASKPASGESSIGFVPQDDIVHSELTVSQAITLSARLRLPAQIPQEEIEELVKRTTARLGLSQFHNHRIHNLSGGQRKRVSIATELLSKPKVLYLDEPSSGLDPAREFKLMKLLRNLAGTDCTVICTTHVLGRSYLFDQLCFIQGGNLIFRGSGEEALKHFKVENLEAAYDLLDDSTTSGPEWRRSFEQSFPQNVCDGPVQRKSGEFDEGLAAKKKTSGNFFHALKVLLQRQWNILWADPLNLAFLAAQALIIGALIGWVAENAVLRMFLAIVATLWFGCSNGAQQIIREIPIFRRERVSGLGLNAYVQSKYAFLTALTAAQALLMYLTILIAANLVWEFIPSKTASTTPEARKRIEDSERRRNEKFAEEMLVKYLGIPLTDDDAAERFAALGTDQQEFAGMQPQVTKAVPGWQRSFMLAVCGGIRNLSDWVGIRENIKESMPKKAGPNGVLLVEVIGGTIGLRLLAILATSLVGVALGLAISAMVRSGIQAVMWVPLVLIPQILLGGFVIVYPEMSPSVRLVSNYVPSFAAQRVMDVANVYGLKPPLMTNRTRIPIFMDGDKKTVLWTMNGVRRTASYDKTSTQNVSWQNLLVFPDRAGQHAIQKDRDGNEKDAVEYRFDVKDYVEGTTFRFMAPAWFSLTVLAGWVLACYGITLLYLLGKERGK